MDLRTCKPPHPNPLPQGEGTRAHTIPLYTSPAHADAWHQIRAPGGYEWWHVDADDERHDRRLVAALFDGDALDPRYVREYARYRRSPTRVPPPLPEQYRRAGFTLYEGGNVRCRFDAPVAPRDFSASTSSRDVTLGPHRIAQTAAGIELHLQFESASVRLNLTPLHQHAPVEISRAPGAAHHWVLASALCDVEGSISSGNDVIPFRGRGYREHRYGTAPLALDAPRWFRGRLLLDDAAYAFQLAGNGGNALLVESTAGAIAEIPVLRTSCQWAPASRSGVVYPRTLLLDDALHLHNPRVIDASPGRARLVYDAVARGGRCGEALCDAVDFERLAAIPLLERLLGKVLDKRGQDGASSPVR